MEHGQWVNSCTALSTVLGTQGGLASPLWRGILHSLTIAIVILTRAGYPALGDTGQLLSPPGEQDAPLHSPRTNKNSLLQGSSLDAMRKFPLLGSGPWAFILGMNWRGAEVS